MTGLDELEIEINNSANAAISNIKSIIECTGISPSLKMSLIKDVCDFNKRNERYKIDEKARFSPSSPTNS